MSPRILLPAVALALALSACSMDRVVGLASPYRADVRQGNFQDPEAVSRLEKGMTRDQVRFLLGTPLLVDPFRNDRWDYVYYVKKGDGTIQQRRLTVFFENDVLVRVAGDVMPTEGDAPVTSSAPRVVEIPGKPPKDEKKNVKDEKKPEKAEESAAMGEAKGSEQTKQGVEQ
ncbi:outer membrane protein assembly factor BamE [Tepidiphilus margaritifer]|uniref:outer membrane protein assembly factor BamE n=1 Tax=Tepidiphilus margaritifer TaxID=203471 RepID=UPI000A016D2A|nr:outer membrane protein assembly factor BamE [Tepidiphilus margaritifer]